MPLTGKLEAALRKIKHLRSDRVFCNPDGSVLTLDQLHERFWMVSRRAGLRRLRWHDLRHSFGSQAAMAGVPIIQVQQWMDIDDRDDDALRPPLSRGGRGLDPDARSACESTAL